MVRKILENSKEVSGKKITVKLRGNKIEVHDNYNSFSCKFDLSVKNEVVSFLRGRATDYRDECFTGRRTFGNNDNCNFDGNWVFTNRLNDICDVIEKGFEKPHFKSGQLKRMSTNNLMDLCIQVMNLVGDI